MARLDATPAAAELLTRLCRLHGSIILYQSGGCCDGSVPMCLPAGELFLSEDDVLLGSLMLESDSPSTLASDPDDDAALPTASAVPASTVPLWMSAEQHASWERRSIVIDAVPGRAGGFSLESAEGMRFAIRAA